MSGIQALLIAAAVLWLIRYAAQARAAGLARLVGVGAALVAIVFVIWPGLTSALARVLGVGRGVDLVIYICFASLAFVLLHLSAKVSELDVRLTDMARRIALDGRNGTGTGGGPARAETGSGGSVAGGPESG